MGTQPHRAVGHRSTTRPVLDAVIPGLRTHGTSYLSAAFGRPAAIWAHPTAELPAPNVTTPRLARVRRARLREEFAPQDSELASELALDVAR